MTTQPPLTPDQRKTALAVLIAATVAISYGISQISSALLYIVALPGVLGYGFWYVTYLPRPTPPVVLLPPFLLTVAAFNFHLIEEYYGGYPLAISRVFAFAWTDFSFFATVCVLSGGLTIASLGLYYQKPVAGFVAILFLVTRVSEIALFIFPFIRPTLQPDLSHPVTQSINGTLLENMPTYYYVVTKHYYFPGMYSVGLVLLPTIFTLYRIWNHRPT